MFRDRLSVLAIALSETPQILFYMYEIPIFFGYSDFVKYTSYFLYEENDRAVTGAISQV